VKNDGRSFYYAASYVVAGREEVAVESLLWVLVPVVCMGGMGLMMWFMAKGMRGSKSNGDRPPDLEQMRAEHRRLGDEIERREQDATRS
jgi:hypothetical protein